MSNKLWLLVIPLLVISVVVGILKLERRQGIRVPEISEIKDVVVVPTQVMVTGAIKNDYELKLSIDNEKDKEKIETLLKGLKNAKYLGTSGLPMSFGVRFSSLEIQIKDGTYINIMDVYGSDNEVLVKSSEDENVYKVEDKDLVKMVGILFYKVNLKKPEMLTLDNVKELAKKGDSLSWQDFNEYGGRDIGSGLYIIEYPISDSDKYTLLIGGSSAAEKPLYIRLVQDMAKASEKGIDIRYEDVDKFIK